MKVLAVLSLTMAVAASYPIVKTMTLSELVNAIEIKEDPELVPYYEEGLDKIMDNLFMGKDNDSQKVILSPSGKDSWTIEELTTEVNALEDSTINDEYKNAIHQALGIYKQKEEHGIAENDIQVVIPAVDISIWALEDLNTAQKNEQTKDELLSYVEKAITEITKPIDDHKKDTVGMVTPVGLLPHEPYF